MKGLVGRAQWETDSGYPPGEDTSELGEGRERGLVVLLLAERARSEGARSTRATEDQPGHAPQGTCV